MEPIYKSHLDQDSYKYSMGSYFWHHYKDVPAEFVYKCRDPQIDLSGIYPDLIEALLRMPEISLQKDEQKWLFENTRVTQNYLINFLKDFRFKPGQVVIKKISEKPGIELRIKGPIQEASLWEMPLMYTISELYFRKLYGPRFEEIQECAKNDLEKKITKFYEIYGMCGKRFTFSEFGTRRRLSAGFQDFVVGKLVERMPVHLIGTSNLHLARKYGIRAVGTMAHEAISFMQAMVHPDDSQKAFMKSWITFWNGWNGIALTDTMGSKKWDRDFTKDLMVDYNGQRHDSGDPYTWGIDRIKAYEREGIDPKEKTLLFSDNLSLDKAWNLSKHFGDHINVTHGIGTFFTNDIPSVEHKALNQVIKLMRANGRPVAKLSDDPMKAQCEDPIFLEYIKHISQ